MNISIWRVGILIMLGYGVVFLLVQPYIFHSNIPNPDDCQCDNTANLPKEHNPVSQPLKERTLPTEVPSFPEATVILPTDCTPYQDWQSVTAILSMRKQNPHKNIGVIRLVSCANDKESRLMEQIGPHYLVPPASPHPVTGYDLATLNKPSALTQWLNEGPGKSYPDDHELIIVDPDFLFISPLPLGLSELGKPAGAVYLLNPGEILPNGTLFSFCGKACESISPSEVREHYNVGPPLFVRVGDMRKLARWWFNVTEAMVLATKNPKKAWSNPGGWLADMYAYMIGAIHEKLPHKTLPGIFLSSIDTMEWKPLAENPNPSFPLFIHYCQKYSIEEYDPNYKFVFHKHDWHDRTTINMLNCDKKVVDNVFKQHGFILPKELQTATPPPITLDMKQDFNSKEVEKKRTLWFLWYFHNYFRDLLREFREEFCAYP